MNPSRTIQAVARHAHPQQNNTTAENSNRARAASHSTSPSSSHDSPQVVNHKDDEQGGDSSHAATHSVDQVNVQNIAAGVLDDVSSLSNTDGDNAKSERMLHQYFSSLAQSETIRSVIEEKTSSQAS